MGVDELQAVPIKNILSTSTEEDAVNGSRRKILDSQ